MSYKKAYVITESKLTESSLPNIITVFILFLPLYGISTEVYSSPTDIEENTIPVPVSLHPLRWHFLLVLILYPFSD